MAAHPLGRAPLFALLLSAATLNALSARIWPVLDGGFVAAILSLFGISAIVWLALYGLARIGFGDRPVEALRGWDKAVAVATLVAVAAPHPIFAAGALFAAACYLCLTSRPGTPSRGVGLIALALTGHALWGPAALALLGPEIARVEAILIGAVSTLHTDGNVFTARDGSQTYVIAGGCSSLANISLAIILAVALAQLLDIRLTWRLLPWAALAIASLILINTLRLVAIGYWPEHFEWLHLGAGRSLFAAGGLLAMSAVTGIGFYRVARAEA